MNGSARHDHGALISQQRILLVLALFAVSLVATAPHAHAAPRTVDVACGDVDGPSGLKAAITTANNSPNTSDIIKLAANCHYVLTERDTAAYDGSTGLPVIYSPITVDGNGATAEQEMDDT